MYYTASSVKNALDANKKLSACKFSIIGCQSQKQIRQTDFLICPSNPKKCDRAIKRICRRTLHVDSIAGKRQLLTVLSFNFTISESNSDGYISKHDSALAMLVREKYINANLLKEINLITP